MKNVMELQELDTIETSGVEAAWSIYSLFDC